MALTLTNADIVSTLEILADEILKAEGGSTTTVKSTEISNVSDVEGYLFVFLSGGLMNAEAHVDSYNRTTFTATLDTTLSEAVTNKSKFALLEVGFQSYIQRAENILTSNFRNKGLDIDKFLNNAQLKQMHIYKAIELICLSKRQDATDEDLYHSNYEAFKDAYGSEFANLVADYDSNGSGVIDDGEEKQKLGQVRFIR